MDETQRFCDWRKELKAAYRLMRMGQANCPPLKKILSAGSGGFHFANAVIRSDGHDYRIEADWIAPFARAWKGLSKELGIDFDENGFGYPTGSTDALDSDAKATGEA